MRQAIEITVERVREGYLLSTIYNDQYVKRLYQGYPIRIAKILFREYVREQDKQYLANQD